MGKLKIAVPTKAYAGLDGTISKVFGKTKTFTIVEVEEGDVKNVRVIDNPAVSYDYGSEAVAAKTLADLKVNCVMAAELGLSATGLLEHYHIRKFSVKTNIKVADVIKENLKAEGLR